MRVIVTRPAAQAADWVAKLRGHGIDALALPLIGIGPMADPEPLRAAWHGLSSQRLVFFVSPNAAEQFFAQRPAGAAWPASVLAGSPGPGTTRVLAGLGVPVAQTIEPAEDARQFDSEAVWERLRPLEWQGANVLIVRGDGGRDWLAQTLREAGAQVGYVMAYRRLPPVLDAQACGLLRLALAHSADHLWFFSSSEAIDNLATCAQLPKEADWRRAQAIATHARIAERARQWGFARVTEVRPSLEAVLACIQSMEP